MKALIRLLPHLLQQPGRTVATLLLGAFGVLAFAPFSHYWLLLPQGLALFLLWGQAGSARQAALDGFLFGLGFFLAGVSWIYVSLSVFGGMPPWLSGLATLLYCSVLALFPTLAGWIFRRWLPPRHWQQALSFASLMALADWSRSWVFTGFPWLAWGYAHAPPSPLAGFAPLIGVFGLSLVTALLAALLARPRQGLTAMALFALAGLGLATLHWSTPLAKPVRVALVQGNIPQEMKFRPEHFFRTLSLYHDLIARHPAELTVLPETAFPVLADQLPPAFIDALTLLARRQQGDIVFGVPISGNDGRYWNSAVSLGTSPVQHYHKRHLVPFGEFIPPGFDWFMALARIPLSSFSRGDARQAPLRLGTLNVALNICYEDVFGDELLSALPEAHLLVNLSNTAWFGDSLAQPQHLQIAQLRALETGRPLLRATNTGMTAVINPDGTLKARLPAFQTGVLEAEVFGHTGETPFSWWGNQAFLLLAATALMAAQAWRFTSPGKRR